MGKVRLREYDIPIPNLPPAFHEYRIVQVTDVHLGRRVPVETVLARLASTRADLVVLTGDIVHRPRFYPLAETFLRRVAEVLPARDGYVGVLGNHDLGLDKLLGDSCPVQWLRNDVRVIRRGDAGLNLLGLDQPGWGWMDVLAAVPKLEQGLPTIALSHFPSGGLVVERFADLVLTGHTHAGQWRLPGLPCLTNDLLGSAYAHGIRTLGRTVLLVCGGLGYSGPLAVRVGAPSEIAAVTLVPGHKKVRDCFDNRLSRC